MEEPETTTSDYWAGVIEAAFLAYVNEAHDQKHADNRKKILKYSDTDAFLTCPDNDRLACLMAVLYFTYDNPEREIKIDGLSGQPGNCSRYRLRLFHELAQHFEFLSPPYSAPFIDALVEAEFLWPGPRELLIDLLEKWHPNPMPS